jgi:hypothetical protein
MVIRIDAFDSVTPCDELGRAGAWLRECDQLAVLVEQRITADVRKLPHETGPDEPDPNLACHPVYQSATAPLG